LSTFAISRSQKEGKRGTRASITRRSSGGTGRLQKRERRGIERNNLLIKRIGRIFGEKKKRVVTVKKKRKGVLRPPLYIISRGGDLNRALPRTEKKERKKYSGGKKKI